MLAPGAGVLLASFFLSLGFLHTLDGIGPISALEGACSYSRRPTCGKKRRCYLAKT